MQISIRCCYSVTIVMVITVTFTSCVFLHNKKKPQQYNVYYVSSQISVVFIIDYFGVILQKTLFNHIF